MNGVSVNLDDFISPFAIGAVDGYFRNVPFVKCGIEYGVVHAATRLAARILQAAVLRPVAYAYNWKCSTYYALCTCNHIAFHVAGLAAAVSIGSLGKIPVFVIGVFVVKNFVQDLTKIFTNCRMAIPITSITDPIF